MAGLGIAGVVAAALGSICLTSGCSSIGYLAQSAGGHLSLLTAAKPVAEWEQDTGTPAALKERLALSQRMRDFAVSELALPDNRSYRAYADLKRPAAVWNVAAAPELSLTLKTWCFPVVGCVGYRGYFDQAQAQAEGASLREQGLEASVFPVPAYSTLGMSNWLGGDPLLNTFIQWPEGELARLIFHELAHQVAYAEGDTTFNESFATAVERIGGERWLSQKATPQAREQYQALDQRRRDFRAFMQIWRDRLDALYRSELPDADKRSRKAALMAQMRADYDTMKATRWAGFNGYDAFVSQLNNASLGMQAAYNELVPAFEALFQQQGGDFRRFYAEVKRLAALPKAERDATLRASMPAPGGSAG
ncbi:MAG TPA: aminopeptidase [Ideonella sp.]|nr:aminopeptidase [Ideonella sp.]